MPQPVPQPVPQTPVPQTPVPQPQTPQPVPNTDVPAPSEIDWRTAAGVEMDEEQVGQTDLFGHFDTLSELKGTKPIMIYFYWPEEDAQSEDRGIANQVRKCKLMDEIISSEEVRRASVSFHCFRVDVKHLSKELKKKYNVVNVPKILFFDVKGKGSVRWQVTTVKIKPENMAKKMDKIAAECKKMLEKMNK